jgi:hypothetical protein
MRRYCNTPTSRGLSSPVSKPKRHHIDAAIWGEDFRVLTATGCALVTNTEWHKDKFKEVTVNPYGKLGVFRLSVAEQNLYIRIEAIDDAIPEELETATLQIDNVDFQPSACEYLIFNASEIDYTPQTFNIEDDDNWTVSASGVTNNEIPETYYPNYGEINLTKTIGPDNHYPITVEFELGGKAVNGMDYTLSSPMSSIQSVGNGRYSVIIPANQAGGMVYVIPNIFEDDESVTLTIVDAYNVKVRLIR